MKLSELDAGFVSAADGHRIGVQFRCPGCRRERIVVPFAAPVGGLPDPSLNVRGVLWRHTGETLETLTLSPSVDFSHVISSDEPPYNPTRCGWHGWVRDGEAVPA